jgi:carotenoid cleavage dioxygenase-like enzyme
MNPHTLETVGESDMDGQIGTRLAGHYRQIDEEDGSKRLVLFGTHVSFAGMHLDFFEMDTEGKVVGESKYQLQVRQLPAQPQARIYLAA